MNECDPNVRERLLNLVEVGLFNPLVFGQREADDLGQLIEAYDGLLVDNKDLQERNDHQARELRYIAAGRV